jgi:prepilin-type N-terminal cleavage/methylation domain-containing protein
MKASPQSGFSLIELMVGMVVGGIVLAAAYSLWHTNQTEGYRLGKKIELRNNMTLASKRIQRAVTLAGIGLKGGANLSKGDDIGSDTLIIFTNQGELSSPLKFNAYHGSSLISVTNPGAFEGASFVVVATDSSRELREIVDRNGSNLFIDAPLDLDHPVASTIALPAMRERYYSNQEDNQLMRDVEGSATVVAKDVRNFQVSFRNKHGESTEVQAEVRTVQFSFTGVFPAREGALSSIVFSSTAIPRNTL